MSGDLLEDPYVQAAWGAGVSPQMAMVSGRPCTEHENCAVSDVVYRICKRSVHITDPKWFDVGVLILTRE